MRGNPHAAFDVAGAGNVAWSRWCDTRKRKGEPTGNTNIDLNRRVSPRPYCRNTNHLQFIVALRYFSTVRQREPAGVELLRAARNGQA